MFPTSSHTLGLVTSWGHSWMVLGTLGSVAWLEDVTQSDLALWYLVSGLFLSLALLSGYHEGRSFSLPHINCLDVQSCLRPSMTRPGNHRPQNQAITDQNL